MVKLRPYRPVASSPEDKFGNIGLELKCGIDRLKIKFMTLTSYCYLNQRANGKQDAS